MAYFKAKLKISDDKACYRPFWMGKFVPIPVIFIVHTKILLQLKEYIFIKTVNGYCYLLES
jgi:hypothetical protein